MSPAAITTVISDYGGVLTSPLAGAFMAVNERHQLPDAALGEAMIRAGERVGLNLLEELECGRVGEPEFLSLLGAQLSADLGRAFDLSQFSEHYFEGLAPNVPMLDELAAVRAGGYRMGLLTNNVLEWGPRWRPMVPVDELFDDVVDSAHVGLRKPDPAIYVLACQRLGVGAHECVFIDDFANNCEAAEALGMTAVWLQDTGDAIDELRRLLDERGAPPRAASVGGPARG
jgi:putative hydrolase of the HAD superfamily